MKFIEPSLQEVYETLLDNDKIIDFLKEQCLLVSKSNLYNDYSAKEIENMKYSIYVKNVNVLYDLAQVLLDHKSEFKSRNINDLLNNLVGWEEMAIALDLLPEDLTADVYKNIVYAYKYCYTSSFFQNNRDRFIPENDLFDIENNPAAEAFLDAMMKEFDKLDCIIGKCCEYLDYDKIPWDLITYLTQMLGFEKTSFNIKEEVKFRELAKNILDLYKMKGTGYSFELFFNFLGFNIKIREFYFDRRLYYLRTAGNLETNAINKSKSEYYLTTSNPTNNELKVSTTDELVLPSDITPQYSLNEFNELCEKYGVEAVLGYSPVYYTKVKKNGKETGEVISHIYEEKVYKYFKTNLIYYDISLDKGNPTPEDYKIITKCLDFLTPSYITRNIKVDTNTGNTEEGMGFDGDGSKYPDAQGNYSEFEMLDSEDWSQEYKNRFAIDLKNDGTLKVTDPYGYVGIDTSLSDPSSPRYDENFIDYNNSLVNKKDISGTDFRLPIGYRLVNKSLNRFLTGTDGSTGENQKNKKIYNEYKRLKFLLIPKINGETVPEGSSGATLMPYYTVPPFVKEGDNEKIIPIKFQKEVRRISLTGNVPDENGELKDTVKNQIKSAHLIKNVKVINNSIEDFIKNDSEYNKLVISKINNTTINKIAEFDYEKEETEKTEEELIRECYNKNIRNRFQISNIRKDHIDTLSTDPNYDYLKIEDYVNNPEIYKNFVYGEDIIAIDTTNKKLKIYNYGSYKIPVLQKEKKDGKIITFYDTENYKKFIYNMNYNLVPAYNGSINSMGPVKELPNSINSKNMSEAYMDIKNKYKEMLDSTAGSKYNLKNINYISKNIYNIKSEMEFFKPVRRGISDDISKKIYESCKTSHEFDSLEVANNHFEKTGEAEYNSHFFVKGNISTWDPSEGLEKLILPNLYTFDYQNRKPGLLIYSKTDNKLYITTGRSNYDYEEVKDFYGRLEFYHEDINGNYHLSNSGIIEENVEGEEYTKKYSIGFGDNTIGEINLYDENWLGYDEQSDEEEFIFYNHSHLVKYAPGKIYDENDHNLPTRINRPVKNLTDKKFDDDIVSSVNESSIGQNIIEDICNKTVEQFLNNDYSNWEETYNPVKKELIEKLNPSEYELYEKSGSSFVLTKDSTYNNKQYYTNTTNGFVSIIERNMELLTGKSVKDLDYDYYSNVHDFLKDYYKIVMYDDYSIKNFPDKLVEDYPPATTDKYSQAQIEAIKKRFNIAILQMGVLMDELYNNKLYYFITDMNPNNIVEGNHRWIDVISTRRLGVWDFYRMKEACPKLNDLWTYNPLMADPYNPIFFDEKFDSELIKYFNDNNIADELVNFKEYYNKFDENTKNKIKDESKKLEFTHVGGQKYYNFKEKNNFFKSINDKLSFVNKHYGKDIIEFVNIDKNILGNDSKSCKWIIKYDNEKYYIKDGAYEQELDLNYYLTSDSFDYTYIPFIFKYGINKFDKDYYGENKEIFSEFSELLSCFCNSLAKLNKDILEDYLKQVYYNNLVSLYRESFIKDDSPLKTRVKGRKPMFALPKNFEKFNGKAGTFSMRNTLMSSYINNGGKNNKDVRLKFNDFSVKINKEGNTMLSFKVSPKDFYNCYGNFWNPYYSKDIVSIDKIISKLLTCIKPHFYFNDKAKDYYSNRDGLTKWQRFRKFLTRDFSELEMALFDVNGKAINDKAGNVISSSGSVLNNDEAFARIKEGLENGYIEIKAYNKDVLKDIHGELQEINDFLNNDSQGVTILNILNEDVNDSSNDERNFSSGFLSIRKLNSKFIDNWISFPESLKWIETDENLLADEFCSLGDDRSINANKSFSYVDNDSYVSSNDVNNINESPEYIGEKNKEGNDNKYHLESSKRVTTKYIKDNDLSVVPYNKCDLVFDENGDPALKIPEYLLHTSNAYKITIIYDDGTKSKLTKRRKAVK